MVTKHASPTSPPTVADLDALPPNLVGEIIEGVLVTKMPYYARVGVAYAWVIDLEARVLTAQRLEAGRWLTVGTYGDETEARIDPFDVVPLNVADWWPPEPTER